MATRVERVVQVLLLLQSGQPCDGEQIADAMNVHRRTVFRDIALLRRLGMPIAHDTKTGCYSLPDSVSSPELTELLIAAAFSIAPEKPALRAAMNKLSRRIPRQAKREVVRAMRSFDPTIPASAAPADETLLLLVIQSIRKGQALALEIDTANGDASATVGVAPLRLSFEEAGWRLRARVLPEGSEQDFWFSTIRQARLAEGSEQDIWFSTIRQARLAEKPGIRGQESGVSNQVLPVFAHS